MLIGQPRQRLDGLDADFLLGARQHRREQVERFLDRRACRSRAPPPAARAHWRSRSISYRRGTARLLPISASASTARSLTHQSVSLRGLDQVIDRALILGLVQDLDRRAPDILVLVAHQLEHRIDDFRAADLAERIAGAAAHPPVVVLDRLAADI